MLRGTYDSLDDSTSTALVPEHSVLLKDDYPRPIDHYIDYFTGQPPALLSERRPLAIARGRRAHVTRAGNHPMARPA
jgi:hypothetical protein